jgi:hypothetical protein
MICAPQADKVASKLQKEGGAEYEQLILSILKEMINGVPDFCHIIVEYLAQVTFTVACPN